MTTDHRARDCRDRSVWAQFIQRPELRSCRLDTDRQSRPCIHIHISGEDGHYPTGAGAIRIYSYDIGEDPMMP